MNTEVQKNYHVDDGHPDENLLLLALERELSPEEADQVEQHLGNCWSCRARSSEMQQGILAFVEYREKRYLPSLETPPYNLQRFSGKLRAIAEQNKPIGRPLRVWRRLWRLMTTPSQIKWAGATAILMVVVVVWTQVFINAPALSASELLTRASAAQNPVNAREKGGIRRTAHQKVRIGRIG